jgi:hypothetical protein
LQEAEQLTPEGRLQRAAVDLVNRLAKDFVLKDEIKAVLREDRLLSEPLRQQALTLLEHYRDDPHQAHRVAYFDIARKPGLDAAKYQLAVRLAEAAERLGAGSDNKSYFAAYHPASVAGIAQYRLGNYREAAATLLRADAQWQEQSKQGSAPWNLAFLAMSQHQLGEKDKAKATLAGLLELMKGPNWTDPGDHQTYVRQARELIEGKAPDPKK